MDVKPFFISFKGLSVIRNYLRPENRPLRLRILGNLEVLA